MDANKIIPVQVDALEVESEAQRLAVVATAAIGRAMDIAKLRRSDIASALDVPKSRVTKVLDGETNMTLKTLAQFGLACGVRWQFVGMKADDSSVIVTAPPSLASAYASPYVRYFKSDRVQADADLEPVPASLVKDCGHFSMAA